MGSPDAVSLLKPQNKKEIYTKQDAKCTTQVHLFSITIGFTKQDAKCTTQVHLFSITIGFTIFTSHEVP
jgi:hypothetical protein